MCREAGGIRREKGFHFNTSGPKVTKESETREAVKVPLAQSWSSLTDMPINFDLGRLLVLNSVSDRTYMGNLGTHQTVP